MKRVVVTGLGVVSSIGNNAAEVTQALKDGKSGIEFMPQYRELGFRSQVAGTLKLNVEELIDRRLMRFMGNGAAYAYLAMKEAIADAGLSDSEVSNDRVRLKLDMFATVQLPTTFRRQAVAVPVGAIQQLETRSVVFVQRGVAQFEAREITVGKNVNGQVEVLAGLREGEPVVMVGAFHLKSIVAGKDLGEE